MPRKNFIFKEEKNMGMVVQHNLTAANANRQLGITTGLMAKSTEKLSSGYRINRASDDAAGLSISEKMRNQIRGLDRASANAQDGISLIQTAEGALNESHAILQRMSELCVQAANDTNVSTDRAAIQQEIGQLTEELTRISTTTQFNKKNLIDGTLSEAKLQIGANENQSMEVTIGNTSATALGVGNITVSEFSDASANITVVQNAITKLSDIRSKLGAIQNRLEHTQANLDTTSENTQAAESRIRDVDMAKEMVSFSKYSILAQAGQSMLAQANTQTQGVMNLLG
jgi:flagellin